jgi:hypothetical protein
MRKNFKKTIMGLIACCLLFLTCENGGESVDTANEQAVALVTKNYCGVLVFQDSLHFITVYNYLQLKQDNHEMNPPMEENADDYKPLTDFEQLKNHFSYRNLINLKEDEAEANGIDLAENPIPEIMEDDEILQTIMNKNRMFIIQNTVFYYQTDCILYKFNIGNDCKNEIRNALDFFKSKNENPFFIYREFDICEADYDFSVLKITSNCREITLDGCFDECNPKQVEFRMELDNPTSSPFIPEFFAYKIKGLGNNWNQLNISDADYFSTTSCWTTLLGYGFDVPITFSNADYVDSISMVGHFKYTSGNSTKHCTTNVKLPWVVGSECPIEKYVLVNELSVTLTASNKCSPTLGTFQFIALDGSPIILSQTPNSITLKYGCAGTKKVKIIYNNGVCQNEEVVSVNPVESALCCKATRQRCRRVFLSNDGNYKLSVKLRERNGSIFAVVKNFEKKNGKFKRRKTNFNGSINGPLYYTSATCACFGIFNFAKPKNVQNKFKMKIKFRLIEKMNEIENQSQMDYFTFIKYWARKNNSPWNLNVWTPNFNIPIVKINCSSGEICDF